MHRGAHTNFLKIVSWTRVHSAGFLVAAGLFSPATHAGGAQCVGSDGLWYPYGDGRCIGVSSGARPDAGTGYTGAGRSSAVPENYWHDYAEYLAAQSRKGEGDSAA